MKRTLTISLASVLLLSGFGLDNSVYAESPMSLFEKTKFDAELQFAETVAKARSNLEKITSNPNFDSEIKSEAKKAFKKLVAEAKNIRDKKIEDARSTYLMTNSITLTEAKQQLTEKIAQAKLMYESALTQAKNVFENEISAINDTEHQKLIKQNHKATLSQLAQTYNESVAKAHAEYELIKNLLRGVKYV